MTRPDRRSRRRVLATIGSGTAAALAGCGGIGSGNDPSYENGSIENASGEGRSAEEMAAAAPLAETEITQSATPLDNLELADHEFVLEDNYLGSTVQGTVENTGGDRIEIAEVRVRVYDDGGAQLGRYVAATGDLEGDASWSFTVVLLESPDDIANYDIAVLGTPS